MINLMCFLSQVSIQRLGARVAVREDIARLLRGAGVPVVARQVPHPLAAAARGVRAAERARRAAPPLAGARPAQRAAAARRRRPRAPRARRGHGRLPVAALAPPARWLCSLCSLGAGAGLHSAHRVAPGSVRDAPWISLFMNLT